MSGDIYQREVNSLDKEIADLEKKKAECDKKCADLQSKMMSIKGSINKNTSASTLASKARQIDSYQKDYNKKASESADLGKKIADKRKRRNDSYLRLQRAQADDFKKQQQEQKRLQQSYERKIAELQRQVIPTNLKLNSSDIDKDEEYDVFISHAYEDKEYFVDEFVEELRKLDLKVWYDTDKLKWGDSMREKIDNGLRKSKFGIVILSPNYIAENKYWTKAELNGLFQIETVNGKTILPIWYNLNKKQVIEYSPIIADRKALTTADFTAEEMAEALKELFLNMAE